MILSGRRLAAVFSAAGLVLPLLTAAAQSPLRTTAAIGGMESRGYRFAAPLPVRLLTQVAFPIGVVTSIGSFHVDVGTYWVATALTHRDGGYRRVTGLTDTQVRVARTLGRETAIASVVVNIPTGRDRMTPADFDVLGTVSSPFLGFPVNAYASGGSVTAALAAALPIGAWNLGAAGSVRASQTFTPVVDPVAGPLNYRAGVEGRLRLGADRLIGESRLALGVTVSGFGDDLYAGLGVTRGAYAPGVRWIAEVLATVPAGSGSVTGTAWGYHRAAGDTAGVSLGNAETLTGVMVTGAWPATPRLTLEPGVEIKLSGVEGGRGMLAGGGIGARLRVSTGVSAWSGLRFDAGYLDLRSLSEEGVPLVARTNLGTWRASVFIRVRR